MVVIQSTDSPRAVGVLRGLRQPASVGVGDGEVKAQYLASVMYYTRNLLC